MRRALSMVAILAMSLMAPIDSGANSCYPAPENSAACKVIPWPSNPYQLPGGYEAQLAIAGGAFFPEAKEVPAAIPVRWGGNLYVHNLDTESHNVVVTAKNCAAPFTGCAIKDAVGLYGLNAGPLARGLHIATSRYEKNSIYGFHCSVHTDLEGKPLHWGYLHVKW